MKALVFALMAAVALSVFALPSVSSSGMTMTMDGYIIDTKCAEPNKDNLESFVKTHTKECALLPACAASGYQFYSMGRLWVLDKESSDKVREFLEKPGSSLHVSMEMSHGRGDMIHMVSVENAE